MDTLWTYRGAKGPNYGRFIQKNLIKIDFFTEKMICHQIIGNKHTSNMQKKKKKVTMSKSKVFAKYSKKLCL